MSTAITLVRLRWALTLAALRKSVWQTVAYVLSAIFAAGTIIGTGILAWFVGMLPPSTMDSDGYPFNILGPGGIVNMVAVLVGATITVFIGLIQLMMLGEGSTMSPRKFALYGIADRNLQFGLLLSGLSGLPAITGDFLDALVAGLPCHGPGSGDRRARCRTARRHHNDEHFQNADRLIYHTGDQQTRQKHILYCDCSPVRGDLPAAEYSG